MGSWPERTVHPSTDIVDAPTAPSTVWQHNSSSGSARGLEWKFRRKRSIRSCNKLLISFQIQRLSEKSHVSLRRAFSLTHFQLQNEQKLWHATSTGWRRNRTRTGNRNRQNRFPETEVLRFRSREEPSERKTGAARATTCANRNRTEPGPACF